MRGAWSKRRAKRALLQLHSTFNLARELHVNTTGPADGETMHAAKLLGEVAASCIAAVKQRKTPAQLLPQVEEAC